MRNIDPVVVMLVIVSAILAIVALVLDALIWAQVFDMIKNNEKGYIPLIIFSFFFLAFFILMSTRLSAFVKQMLHQVIQEIKINKRIKNPLPNPYKRILQDKFPYYLKLDNKQRLLFEKKVYRFILTKKFISTKDITHPDDEMKVLIAASAAQLTLGLPEITLSSFTNIILYRYDYYNPVTKHKHAGEVNPRGTIILTWENFVKGYALPSDAYNLGLHEMAHALKLENYSPGNEYLFLDKYFLSRWDKFAEPVFKKINSGEHTFLRSYAGTNGEEFFAVCVEYFFEKPDEFSKVLPDLYNAMCQILNQDPKKIYSRSDNRSLF